VKLISAAKIEVLLIPGTGQSDCGLATAKERIFVIAVSGSPISQGLYDRFATMFSIRKSRGKGEDRRCRGGTN
jgi:hypothetical protein